MGSGHETNVGGARSGPTPITNLKKKRMASQLDLNFECPREIRDRIAGEIIDEWDLVGRALGVSDAKVKSISGNTNYLTLERKAVAVLDAWAEEHGSGATCLKLEEALKLRKNKRVREILYKEIIRFKKIETTSGACAAVPPQPSDNQQQEQGETSLAYTID